MLIVHTRISTIQSSMMRTLTVMTLLLNVIHTGFGHKDRHLFLVE